MVKKILLPTLVLFLFCVLYLPRILNAEGGPSSSSVTVVPPRFELWGNPGEPVPEQSLRVTNETDSEATYAITVEDFGAQGEEGNVNLYDDGQSNGSFSLAKWITVEPQSLTMGPKETKIVTYSINIPKNAEPGGRYASVVVNSGGRTKVQGGAAVSPRVVSLVLLRVSGDVKEEASIESFTAPKYSETSPVNFDLRVKNSGRNHIKPKGTIIITNIFGKKVGEVQLNGENVLPGAIRKMTTEWKAGNALAGRYTATLAATYGEKNDKRLSTSVSFIVISKKTAVLYGVGMLLVGLMVSKRKKVRKALHNLTK